MGQTSEGARKAAKTRKRKYGKDFHKLAGSKGGSSRKRDYFSELKKESPEKLQEISKKGGEKGSKYFADLAKKNPTKFRKISGKGGKGGTKYFTRLAKENPEKLKEIQQAGARTTNTQKRKVPVKTSVSKG